MNESPLSSLNITWLCTNDSSDPLPTLEDEGGLWQHTPLPENLGVSAYRMLHLPLGMSLLEGEHRLAVVGNRPWITLATVEMQLKEPSFMVQIVHRGRAKHRDIRDDYEIEFGSGVDLYRYSTGMYIEPSIHGLQSMEFLMLAIPRSMLNTLLGEVVSTQLLSHLGILGAPHVVARPTPAHVSSPLIGCIPDTLTGIARKLGCQSRILDYLSKLVRFTSLSEGEMRTDTLAKDRVETIRQQLLNTEGKLPTLDELAKQYSRSAKTLNDEFEAAYGESIYSFISNHRLQEARLAIQQTTIPLKLLAARLGYSHVNHFNAAFRKRFGYPPGSLRK